MRLGGFFKILKYVWKHLEHSSLGLVEDLSIESLITQNEVNIVTSKVIITGHSGLAPIMFIYTDKQKTKKKHLNL